MNWTKRVVVAVAVGFVAVSLAPQLKADCAPGDSRFAGSRGVSSVQWDLKDAAADYAYFMVEAPTVNEGALGDPAVFKNIAADLRDFGSTLDEALVVGESFDLGGAGLGTTGCPAEGQRGVFLFSDSHGTTCVSVVGRGFYWDFDTANPNTTPSPGLGEGAFVLTRDASKVEIAGGRRNADETTSVDLSWRPPQCFTDAPFTVSVTSYNLLADVVQRTGGTSPSVAGASVIGTFPGTQTSATVTLPATPGADTFLFIGANLGNSGRGSISGASSAVVTDPNLALSGKSQGKGKGLIKAPGQNK